MFGSNENPIGINEFTQLFLRPQNESIIPPCPPCYCQCPVHNPQQIYYYPHYQYPQYNYQMQPTPQYITDPSQFAVSPAYNLYPNPINDPETQNSDSELSDDSLHLDMSDISDAENEEIPQLKWAEEDELLITINHKNLLTFVNTFKTIESKTNMDTSVSIEKSQQKHSY